MTHPDLPQGATGMTSKQDARDALANWHRAVQADQFAQAQDWRDYLLRWVPDRDRDRAKALMGDYQLVLMEAHAASKRSGDFESLNKLNAILGDYLDQLLALEVEAR